VGACARWRCSRLAPAVVVVLAAAARAPATRPHPAHRDLANRWTAGGVCCGSQSFAAALVPWRSSHRCVLRALQLSATSFQGGATLGPRHLEW